MPTPSATAAEEHRGAGDVLGVDVGARDPDDADDEHAEDGHPGPEAPGDQQPSPNAGSDRARWQSRGERPGGDGAQRPLVVEVGERAGGLAAEPDRRRDDRREARRVGQVDEAEHHRGEHPGDREALGPGRRQREREAMLLRRWVAALDDPGEGTTLVADRPAGEHVAADDEREHRRRARCATPSFSASPGLDEDRDQEADRGERDRAADGVDDPPGADDPARDVAQLAPDLPYVRRRRPRPPPKYHAATGTRATRAPTPTVEPPPGRTVMLRRRASSCVPPTGRSS